MDNDTPYYPDPFVTPTVGTGGGVEGLFGIAVFFVIVIGAISLFIWLRNVNKVVQSGNDPTTFETDLAIRAMQSQALAPAAAEAPARSTADRLADLDALLAAGTITTDEHTAARAKVLGEI